MNSSNIPNINGLNPIECVCKSIDISSKSCYHTQFLYWVCKIFEPTTFIETGVHYGASSAFILKAFENTDSTLYSIDLPDCQYIKDDGDNHHDKLHSSLKPGFVVPNQLRKNWNLILGDSKKELPELVKTLRSIDIFHHDSMHTYDFMMFEFETVLPKIRNGGLILSDDADWNNAFKDFCDKHSLEYCIYRHTGIAIK